MSNKPISSLEVRTQDLTGADLMLISQFTAAGWRSAQVTLEDFFIEMFQPGSSAGQIIVNMQSEINQLDSRMDMHEHPELNTADPNYDPHFGFFLRLVTKVASNSGLVGDGRAATPLALDYTYLNAVYARSSTIVDNLTSTSATTPLSANMGRALNVAKTNISETRQNFGENIVSLIATTGYNFNNALPGDYVYLNKQTATAANSPPFEYSTTFTECSINTSGQRFQIARDYQTGQIAVRALQNSTWSAWRKQLMEGDVGGGSTVGSADKLTTPRRINNVLFDGTQDITIYADLPYKGAISPSVIDATVTPGYYGITSNPEGFFEVRVVNGLVLQYYHTTYYATPQGEAYPTRHLSRMKKGGDAWTAWQSVGPKIEFASTGGVGVVQLNNTLTSTATNQALTAAQGKVLKDTKVDITAIRDVFGNRPIDLIVPAGYNFNNIMPGEFVFYDGGANITNPPPFAYCSVYCERSHYGTGERTVTARDYFTGRIATRGRNNNSWSTWQTHLVAVDVANAITTHKAETDPHPQYVTIAELAESTADGLTEHVLDLSTAGFDANTYYPVTVAIANKGRCSFEIDTPLWYAAAPWSTHGGGTISVTAKWSEYPSVWGSNNIDRTIDVAGFWWCVNSPVISITQLTNSSTAVFFLRGKTKYRVRMTKTLVPVIRTASYSISSQTVAPKVFDNTAPISIMNEKIGQSHLTDPNPHPQYVSAATLSTDYYPKTGGTVTGDIVAGTPAAPRVVYAYGNITSEKTVRGLDIIATNAILSEGWIESQYLRLRNAVYPTRLQITPGLKTVFYTIDNLPPFEQGEHVFWNPIRSTWGYGDLFSSRAIASRWDVTNNGTGAVIGEQVMSYVVFNSKVEWYNGSEMVPLRYCQVSVDYILWNNPGETSSKLVFPIEFVLPPVVVATRKTWDKDSAGTMNDADGGVLVQFANTAYCYISCQVFNPNSQGGLRGFTLQITGWVRV